MLALEAASFAAAWGLARLAVPGLTLAGGRHRQLAANAASRAVPGGVVVGGAVYFRLLRRSGVEPAGAAAALTANSLISNMVLFALPAAGAFVGGGLGSGAAGPARRWPWRGWGCSS